MEIRKLRRMDLDVNFLELWRSKIQVENGHMMSAITVDLSVDYQDRKTSTNTWNRGLYPALIYLNSSLDCSP